MVPEVPHVLKPNVSQWCRSDGFGFILNIKYVQLVWVCVLKLIIFSQNQINLRKNLNETNLI